MGFGPTFLPPTEGLTSLAQKFGQRAQAVGNTVGGLATKVADAGRAVLNGPGVDPTPDNSPAASAVRVKAPTVSADIQSAAGYLAPNAPAGSFGSLKEKYASGKGITPAIAEGAYQDRGGYGEFGTSQPRSLAAMLQDRDAQALLDQTYGAEQAAIKASAPDYQGDSLKARQRDAEYEALSTGPRPLFSSGDTLGSFYKSGNTISNTPTGLTLREQIQNQQAQAKNAPGMLDLGRGQVAADLQTFRGNLDAKVKAGRLAPQDADAQYAIALKKANDYAAILKSGFPANDPLGGAGSIPPGPAHQ